MQWCAYVDESMRQRRDGSGIYVLAAAVVRFGDAEGLREVLGDLGHGKRRFHWRLEERRDQLRAVRRLSGLDAFHVVVIAQPMDSVRQERARRGALQRLLWELDQLSVGLVLLDRRTDSLNRRDRALVDALRGSGVLRPTLVIDFAHSYNGIDGEILLWIPDIVAGAAAAAHGDGDRSFLDPMGHLVLEIPLELG